VFENNDLGENCRYPALNTEPHMIFYFGHERRKSDSGLRKNGSITLHTEETKTNHSIIVETISVVI